MVGRVGLQLLRFLPGDQRDVRILFPENLGDSRLHRTEEFAVVQFLEPLHTGEPCDGVAQRPLRDLNQHIPPGQVEIVPEDRLVQRVGAVDLQREPDIILLHALHRAAGLDVHAVEQTAGVEVAENTPVFPAFREQNPESVVEIEPDVVHRLLRRDHWRRHKGRLLRFILRRVRQRRVLHRLALDGDVIHWIPPPLLNIRCKPPRRPR